MRNRMSVAVFGSCVSRDIFDVRESPFDVVAYQARTSWISQTGDPVPNARALYGGTPGVWDDDMGLADLEKTTLPTLIAAKPDILLIDVADDAGMPTMQAGAYLASWNRWGHKRAALTAAGGEPPRRAALEGEALVAAFTAAVTRLGAKLQAALPDTAMVLTVCRSATSVRGEVRGMPYPVLAPGRGFDATIAPLEAALLATLPGVSAIEGDPALRIADAAHHAGPMYLHFVPEYYDDILTKLETLAGLR
jgi:hypothetical protein